MISQGRGSLLHGVLAIQTLLLAQHCDHGRLWVDRLRYRWPNPLSCLRWQYDNSCWNHHSSVD